MTNVIFDPRVSTWTCFGCAYEQPDDADTPDRCPVCGGVWVRPLHLGPWQRMKDSIRRRFERTRTFDNADDLIAWLEGDDHAGS